MNNQENNQFYRNLPTGWKLKYNLRFLSEHFLGFKPFMPYFNKINKNQAQKINQILYESKETIIDVPSVNPDTTPKEIQRLYVKKGMPFVIRNGASEWNAYQKWDFDFFKNSYGNHPVLLTYHSDLGEESKEAEQTNLREIIEGLDNNSMKYARFNPLLDTYPELQDELDQSWLNQVRDTKLKKHHVLFIGNKGTKTTIHNAGNENIFVHVRGKKRWLLWDQRAYYILNPEVNRAPAKASKFTPEHENKEIAFFKLPRYEIVCEPGDILYVPSYLWHHVENLSPTIGVGIRWLSPSRTMANCPLLSFLEVFNTSPSLFHTLDWRKGFDFNKVMMKNLKKRKS